MTRQMYLTDNQWYALRDLVQSNTDTVGWNYDTGDHIETFIEYVANNFGVVYNEESAPRQGVLYWGRISFPTDIDYTLFILKYSGTAFEWLLNKDFECLSV